MSKAPALLLLALLGTSATSAFVKLPMARSQPVRLTTAEQLGFVIEYDRPPPTFGQSANETWTKRGELVRVDVVSGPSGGRRAIRRSTYQTPGQKSVFTVGRYTDGSVATLFLMRDPLSYPPPLSERTFSGASEKHLGQTCRLWRRSVPQSTGGTFDQSGCVSATGVELWWRNANIDAIFARSIRRVPVQTGDVQPPLDLLDFRKWMVGTPAGAHQGDYEVVLTAEHSALPSKVARRSGNWLLEHERSSSSESLTLTNRQANITLRYNKGSGDDAQLTISKDAFGSTAGVAPSGERLANLPDETLLGERCQWWNMTKGMTDYGRAECRTKDGVPLIIRTTSWGSGWTIKASKFKRGAISMQSIVPPAGILAPATWGLAQRR